MPAAKPPEFRRRVVDLARAGDQPVAKIASDLGISESCLRGWMAVDDVDAGCAEGLTTSERKELVDLRSQNRVQAMEIEILKRASLDSTGQRNTLDDQGGGGAWRRSVDLGCHSTVDPRKTLDYDTPAARLAALLR